LLNRNLCGLGDVGGEHGMGWRLETSPPLRDIEDVESVYQLVPDLREKTRTAKATTF
jgi:hypothetical protein